MASSRDNIKKVLIALLVVAFLALLSGIFFFYKFYSLSQSHYVKYSESSSLDYQVCLKENSFYEGKCLSKDNQYIASLIDYIPVTFNYSLSFPNHKINYKYSYRIEAEFDAIDKDNKKSLFTNKETLYESDVKYTDSTADIKYDLNIDYNKYNDLLNSFIKIYNLDETTNSLRVSMYVNVSSSDDTFVEDINKDSVINLSIPLTTKTVNIDISDTTSNDKDKEILIKNEGNYTPFLALGTIDLLIAIIILVDVIIYIKNTRTYKEIYDRRIKRITTIYDSYIQRINGNYPIGASQICKVVSFKDILEIKDTVDKPLLMLENEEKTGTFFIIPLEEGVIYTYALRIEDIIAEKSGDKAPDYDIDDINVINENKPKKYTKERIKNDIEKTQSIKIVDDKNAIRGTKDTDEDLYDQLDKTSTFKIIKDSSRPKSNKKKRSKRQK